MTYIPKSDVKNSCSGCFDFHLHINQIIKAVQNSECDSCLCIWGHILLCCRMQLNFEFGALLCMRACVCIRVQQLLLHPRQDDWICQPAANVNYFSNLQAHFSPITPITGNGMSSALSARPAPDRAPDWNLFWKRRNSNELNNKEAIQSVAVFQMFSWSLTHCTPIKHNNTTTDHLFIPMPVVWDMLGRKWTLCSQSWRVRSMEKGKCKNLSLTRDSIWWLNDYVGTSLCQ